MVPPIRNFKRFEIKKTDMFNTLDDIKERDEEHNIALDKYLPLKYTTRSIS